MDVINSLLRAARAGNLKRVMDFIEDDLVDINSSNQNGLTALHSACKEGHQRVVQELLANGANVHAKTLKGNTPLHIASLAGHEPVVRLLIESGADVDAQSVSGFTALYMAAQENHQSIVKLLLANNANQNLATTDGFTPLAVAMQQGHEQVASILLNNEARGRIRFPGTTESGRSLLHIAAKKDDCAAAALLMQNNISPDITSKSGFSALHVACHYGNENVARLLIERQADVNFRAKHNITPLHVAAKWGKGPLVSLLLANGARIDAITRDRLTPLHCAARSGHDQVVEQLIAGGAPLSAKTRSGLAPLHMATQGDHLSSAQILLANGAPVDDVTVDYLTALHVASHCGHVKVAKLLLDRGAEANFRALNGFTSLHIACKKNRLKVVELLLKHGASLNSVTESGLTPLHVASFMGCVDIVIYLLENKANIESVTVRGETPLHLATRANQLDVIKILIDYGANVGARAKESQTALHIASRLGNPQIARLLIEHGCQVDAPTNDSYTALHIAAKEGQLEVVETLLNFGANISCSTRNHGFTPLHLASKYGIEDVVELLLRYGAPVDAQGKNGVTPLHVATHYNHPGVVRLLLGEAGRQTSGASPHAMAKNGYTALHIAAKGDRLEIAEALLASGARPGAESKAGFCPLHLAAQEGRLQMAALLLVAGANVNCRAKNGITPMHLCAQEDHVEVAQLLARRGAQLDVQTKGGFTPLHVASHFARLRMIRFLLAQGADVNVAASSGYTPLHQAAQQGQPEIVDLLLQYKARPDALTEGGQTALSIAENLGYVSIIDTLKIVTETIVKTTTMTITEEKFKLVAPETMQETFVSDSEDEADDQAHAESVKFLTTDVMKNFNQMSDDYSVSQSNLQAAQQINQPAYQNQQLQARQSTGSQRQLIPDEMSQDLQYLSREAPLDGGESTFGAATSYSQLHNHDEGSLIHMGSEMPDERLASPPPIDQLAADNVELARKPMQQAGFLVSFMVDARGGAMCGCRHSGVRVIIPPNSAQMPMRITCRYLRRERLVHPPPLMDGEACASKIMEVGPAGAKFLGPVLIEVPHFASLRNNEREIIILRSDTGEIWREHMVEVDERLVDSIIASARESSQPRAGDNQENQAPASDLEDSVAFDTANSKQDSRQLTRILTTEFPQYFAIISRIKQEVHAVGPQGTNVQSQLESRVEAVFPPGALKKRIKIGLQDENKQSDETKDQAGEPNNRPASAQAKRRSRLLACFGTGQGSIDLSSTEDSPGGRIPCDEKPCEQRRILGDVDDSDAGAESPARRRHLQQTRAELVPEDYYIEPEPSLILNVEPKTYGKRLASSAVQTDAQLNNERLSTSAKSPRKKRGGGGCVTCPGAGLGKRKNKAQMNILYDTKSTITRPKSALDSLSAPDSSLDTVSHSHQDQAAQEQILDQSSVILDMIQSDDLKWRTCTIQTDSDSVTVNYVTIAQEMADGASAGDNKPTVAHASTGQDDGYVSGSGDINRQSSFGKGLFSLPFSSSAEPGADKKKAKKQRKGKQRPAAKPDASAPETAANSAGFSQQVEDSLIMESEPKSLVTESRSQDVESPDSLASGAGDLSSVQRSVSPSSKELKLKRKQEMKEKARQEKEQKNREEAANKAEKLRQKQEKEELKKAERRAKKLANKSPTPTPDASIAASTGQTKDKVASVTFAKEVANSNDDTSQRHPEAEQLDSIQRVIESTSTSYEAEKKRLSQEDGHDLLGVSISVDPSAPALIASEEHDKQTKGDPVLSDKTVEQSAGSEQLLGKSRPSLVSGASVEITISDHGLRDTLTDKAIDTPIETLDGEKLEASETIPTKKQRAKLDKEERERVKREAKAMAKEEQRLAKEAKLAAKEVAKIKKREKKEAKRKSKETKNISSPETDPQVGPMGVADSLEEPASSVEAPKEVSSKSELDETTTGKGKKSKKDKGKKGASKKATASDGEAPVVATSISEAQSSGGEPSGSSVEKSSFLSRLFKRRVGQEKVAANDRAAESSESKSGDAKELAELTKKEDEVILSEMYPRDPLDADGEMILEVNVPKELIEKQQLNSDLVVMDQPGVGGDWSVASDAAASPTLATTCDETLATSELNDGPPEGQPRDSDDDHDKRAGLTSEKLDDQDEATLVNMSQFEVTSHTDCLEDDEATENVLSQTIELSNAAPKEPELGHRDEALIENLEPAMETESVSHADAIKGVQLDDSEALPAAEGVAQDLGSEEAKRELEQKLGQELKKRTKEEEKQLKREAKAEKLRLAKEQKLAAEEAKKQAKEEKKRAKREAKEAAAKAKEEKAKLKGAKKDKKKSGKKDAAEPASDKPPVELDNASPKSDDVVDVQQMIKSGVEEAGASGEPIDLELEGMEPVNTETEVQRIVEEVVDEEGLVTRTTRTIETKLVTLRSEEIKTQERRDVPIEEYEEELRKQTACGTLDDEPTSSPQAEVSEELRQIIATPSYFGPQFDPNTKADGSRAEKSLSPKKDLKKRIKLNKKLVKRALRFAKSEAKVAKREANNAEAEIANCDLAARQAQKQLKLALRESKRAAKAAAHDHKRMDKVDKKLAKRQKKIESKQRKLDKQAAKLAKKAAKERDQALAKEAKAEKKREKKLKKSSSSSLASASASGSKLQRAGSSGSKKSGIKLEDIGAPVLKSSSRLSIGQPQQQDEVNLQPVDASTGQQESEMVSNDVVERQKLRSSVASADDLQVEMSLEQEHDIDRAMIVDSLEGGTFEPTDQTTRGQSVQFEQQTGQVSSELATGATVEDGSGSEIIDVVNDGPESTTITAATSS